MKRLGMNILLLFLSSLMMFISVSNVQSFLPQPIGVIKKIQMNSVTVELNQSEQKIIKLSPAFEVFRLTEKGARDLKTGDSILLIGFKAEGQRASVREIIISPPISNQQESRGLSSAPADIVFCKIVNKNPLTIQKPNGHEYELDLSPMARIVQEIPLQIGELNIGDRVRILQNKIIVLPQPAEMANRSFYTTTTSPSDTMLGKPEGGLRPDLAQESSKTDFIYGIWLGRGLYSNSELARAFRVAANLGIKYLKVEFNWDYVEPQNNQWNWNNKGILDVEYVIGLARQYNLSIIPYFCPFMPWGEIRHLDPRKGECEAPFISKRGQSQAPDPAAYAEYVFSVVNKLESGGVHVDFIELDNEVSAVSDGHRSWSCFHNMTARQIKLAENAAYDRVKRKYPNIMISSTTFNMPGLAIFNKKMATDFSKRLNSFVKVYFEEEPKPKFDFLGIHEIFPGSGNPFTTDRDEYSGGGHNFSSYHDGYDIWRNILNKYDYTNIPIFTTESTVILKGKQDAQLLQKVIFARINSKKNNVIGWIVSQLTGSIKFTENSPPGISVGITNLANGYELREGYDAFYTLMTTLTRYPKYERKIAGDINIARPWVEEFSDNQQNLLYVAFIPYQSGSISLQTVRLKVDPERKIKITQSDSTHTVWSMSNDGYISLNVNEHPIFVEVRK